MKKVFLFFATLLALFSCDEGNKAVNGDEGNKAKDKAFKTTMSEKGQLSVLLSKPVNDENYSDFNRSPNGLLYKFHRVNEGETLTKNDVVEIRMDYFFNDSLLFSSRSFPKRFDMPVESSVFKGDFYEGLSMMHVGDSASFVVRADSTYRCMWKKSSSGVKETDVVRFDVGIVSKEDRTVFSQRIYAKKRAQAEQSRSDLQVYLHDNGIVEKPRPSGLIIVPIVPGYGAKATSGDMVKIHFNAELIDGTPYKSTRETNIPVTLTLSGLPEGYPRGLDEALHQMREGEIAKVIIPSHLAFGQQEVYNLPPFSNFVYEIEVLEVIKNNK